MVARDGSIWLRAVCVVEMAPDGSSATVTSIYSKRASEPYPALAEDSQGRILTAPRVHHTLLLWEKDHWRVVTQRNGLSPYEVQTLFVDREDRVPSRSTHLAPSPPRADCSATRCCRLGRPSSFPSCPQVAQAPCASGSSDRCVGGTGPSRIHTRASRPVRTARSRRNLPEVSLALQQLSDPCRRSSTPRLLDAVTTSSGLIDVNAWCPSGA